MADDDHPSNPGTQAFTPDFSDDEDAEDTQHTGTQSWVPDFSDDDDTGEQPAAAKAESTPEGAPATEEVAAVTDAATDSGAVPVQSVTVPGRYVFLKWWKLVLLLLVVWAAAALVGLGLFSWWYHADTKTPALFAVLVYVVACAVGAVMLAMVQGRALISALSIAVMSAPFASLLAAAPLHSYYHCARVGHCLIGVIPY